MLTIIETHEFRKESRKLLTEDEIADLIVYLAFHPEAGDLIQGSGGFRKLRWARKGKGKSGGVRTVYFYYNQNNPLMMTTIYSKNEKEDLSKAEINELYEISKAIKHKYGS